MHFSELQLTVGLNNRIYFTLPVDSEGFLKKILVFEQQ